MPLSKDGQRVADESRWAHEQGRGIFVASIASSYQRATATAWEVSELIEAIEWHGWRLEHTSEVAYMSGHQSLRCVFRRAHQ
ncbi:hypothetical protein AB0F17_17155 [Nonomuraea sp. NPDC026600]|uniref:hypothetical protein n=1 Tax=Nonomuraea sp. NPDC026600 TaxID=3155363 RepID=UPI0033C8C27E